MISDELKEYVNDQIEKTLKSTSTTVTVVPPQNSGLERRLLSAELALVATILTLRKFLPEFEWKQRIAETYNRLKKKESLRTAQDVSAAIAELDSLLEQDELPEK